MTISRLSSELVTAPSAAPPRLWARRICQTTLQITPPPEWPGHPGHPGHLAPSWQTRRDQNTPSQTSFIHLTPIFNKEDQRIRIFPHFTLYLSYFSSVSKSDNMKWNAAEKFIKPTTHQEIECQSNCLLNKMEIFNKTVFGRYGLSGKFFQNPFQHQGLLSRIGH